MILTADIPNSATPEQITEALADITAELIAGRVQGFTGTTSWRFVAR